MAQFFTNVFESVLNFLKNYQWVTDTLDILLVAFAIFWLIKLVRDSRAEQLLKGFLLLGVAYGAAYVLSLTATKYLLQILFDNALIVLVVIFQPEIRRALERVGHSGLVGKFKILGMNEEETEQYIHQWKTAISAVCSGVDMLQRQKMGALIVFERSTRLGEIAKSGTEINADPTGELIGNIFFNKAPLHDGATIIRDGKVYASGCILPLSDNVSISRSLGTRHRAGVGMSENSDAVVVIVSEETGTISVAKDGVLKRDYTVENLRIELENELVWKNIRSDDQKGEKNLWKRIRGWFSK
ncbi:MAG: diadenylate cyclase CdaA [Clostridia bacterium]|nr:diadenylate cyclase CdaA [Clostridia bacterium]